MSVRAHSRTGRDGATLAAHTEHVVTCARSCLFHLSESEPISTASAVVACSAGDDGRHGSRAGHSKLKSNSSRTRDGADDATGRLILPWGRSGRGLARCLPFHFSRQRDGPGPRRGVFCLLYWRNGYYLSNMTIITYVAAPHSSNVARPLIKTPRVLNKL